MKRRVVHFNQLKLFNRGYNQGQGWIAVETGPTEVLRPSTKPGNDAEVIVLEDDVFRGGC